MLQRLTIRNLAVIDTLDLEFTAGFNVLTGETGAGKSILIGAIGLILGERADSDAVRTGAARADVTAEFQLASDSAAARWLADQALDDPDDAGRCVVRRLVNADSGSRAFINGQAANVSSLRALGESLVDVHGQHASQGLLRSGAQRALLDASGVPHDLLQTVGKAAATVRDLERDLDAARAARAPDASHIELLRYQLDELEATEPHDGEYAELDAEQRRLANAEQLMRDAGTVIGLLSESDDGAAAERAGRARDLLQALAGLDDAFAEPAETVDAAVIQLEEAARTITRLLDRMELDPQRLAEVEQRLSALHQLARKHDCEPDALAQRAESLAAELQAAEQAGTRAEELASELAAARDAYAQVAQRLHEARCTAADTMAQAVQRIVRTLGMPDAVFAIDVDHQPDDISATGSDRVTFTIAANPGQSARPLSRVASGGELSRLALAIQIVVLGEDAAPTLIFDEVDAGIGGAVAEIVGRRLRELAGLAQVLCVTHLPQVAAQGMVQFHVRKHTDGQTTQTQVATLTAADRVEEIARMLGGVDVTERTRATAAEMLQAAEQAA